MEVHMIKKFKWTKILRNVFIGTLLILALYGLFPEEYRSSRAIIVIGNFVVLITTVFSRILAQYIQSGKLEFKTSIKKKVFVISNQQEAMNIKAVLEQSQSDFSRVMIIPPGVSATELIELIDIHEIDEIICNSKDLGMNKIIQLMAALGDLVDFKITGDETLGIIGSQSKNKNGEIYTVVVQYKLQEQENIRIKRTIDLLASLVLLVVFPLLLIKGKRINLLLSLIGVKTIVSYNLHDENLKKLPYLKPGLIPITSEKSNLQLIHHTNLYYAKEYSARKDIERILKYLSE